MDAPEMRYKHNYALTLIFVAAILFLIAKVVLDRMVIKDQEFQINELQGILNKVKITLDTLEKHRGR